MNLTPLHWAAQTLATIMAQVDEEMGDIDEALMLAFKNSHIDLQTSVTRRQALAAHIRSTKLAAKEYRDTVTAYIHRLDRLEERMKEDALKAIDALPGVELRGANGKKLYSGNSQSAKLEFAIQEKKTFTNLVDLEAIEMFGVQPHHFKMIFAYQIDLGAIKKDLKLGIKLKYAHLEESRHVGGLFPSPKESASGDE